MLSAAAASDMPGPLRVSAAHGIACLLSGIAAAVCSLLAGRMLARALIKACLIRDKEAEQPPLWDFLRRMERVRGIGLFVCIVTVDAAYQAFKAGFLPVAVGAVLLLAPAGALLRRSLASLNPTGVDQTLLRSCRCMPFCAAACTCQLLCAASPVGVIACTRNAHLAECFASVCMFGSRLLYLVWLPLPGYVCMADHSVVHIVGLESTSCCAPFSSAAFHVTGRLQSLIASGGCPGVRWQPTPWHAPPCLFSSTTFQFCTAAYICQRGLSRPLWQAFLAAFQLRPLLLRR